MMSPATVVPPPIQTSTSPPPNSQSSSPTSTRSRIRAFNYLRHHYSSSSSQNQATPTPETPSAATPQATNNTRNASSNIPDASSPGSATTSWLPTVGGISGLSRVPSAPSAEVSTVTGGFRQMSISNGADNLTSEGNGVGNGLDGHTDSPSKQGDNAFADGKNPTIRFVPHLNPSSNRRPHTFIPMERTIKHPSEKVRVGRFSDKDQGNPVGFKSKVVSRRHCEFWYEKGNWLLKDVGSSSGTFLNHIRLSNPNTESKPYTVRDGDVVQLGMDFKGGEELIFRCVKIKLELNRDAKLVNDFNVAAHKKIQNLGKKQALVNNDDSDMHTSECAICLLNIAPCQSLFVAPCSHVWHYKCIRPILDQQHPAFICPNCRECADLEAEIEESDDSVDGDAQEKAKSEDGAGQISDNAADGVDMSNGTHPPDVPGASLHLTIGSVGLSEAITDPSDPAIATDPVFQTPRNNSGPFILNGTTGRM